MTTFTIPFSLVFHPTHPSQITNVEVYFLPASCHIHWSTFPHILCQSHTKSIVSNSM